MVSPPTCQNSHDEIHERGGVMCQHGEKEPYPLWAEVQQMWAPWKAGFP